MSEAAFSFSPKLDDRLQAVADLVDWPAHADLGTDHAHLPIHLIQHQKTSFCVATDLNAAPLALAERNVKKAGLEDKISLRLGDGLGPLLAGEVDGLSMTGLGGATMARVLEAGRLAQKLPPQLVLQPNNSPFHLRRWALNSGYELKKETLVAGYWPYAVLHFAVGEAETPYMGLPKGAALRYGPQLLREAHPLLRRVLGTAWGTFEGIDSPRAAEERADIEAALDFLGWTVGDLQR